MHGYGCIRRAIRRNPQQICLLFRSTERICKLSISPPFVCPHVLTAAEGHRPLYQWADRIDPLERSIKPGERRTGESEEAFPADSGGDLLAAV